MKVILCGYNWVGCKALTTLLEKGHEVFVYTSENPPYVNSVIELCEKLNVKHSIEKITKENLPFKPDVICSIYYRYIIKKDVIDTANGRIFNLHPSLLPDYRGCSSLTWAMIKGEKEVGYTYHYIDEGVDTGDIIIQKKLGLEEFDTQASLYNRVMFEAAKHFYEAFEFVAAGKNGTPQKGTGSHYKRGCPHDGKIPQDCTMEEADMFIRAMNYPPLPYATTENGIEIKTLSEYKKLKNIWI